MYSDISAEVQARSNKSDANLVVAALITNATGAEEIGDSRSNSKNKGLDSSAITWEAFQVTIT